MIKPMEIFFTLIISLLFVKPLETQQKNINVYDNLAQNTIIATSKLKEITKENKEVDGMNPLTKDIIDTISKAGSLFSVFLAIYLAVYQAKKYRDERKTQVIKEEEQKQKELEEIVESRKQRQEDLRWRKASLAKDVLDELRNDSFCKDAMLMLDWNGRSYSIKVNEGETKIERINHQEMLFAWTLDKKVSSRILFANLMNE
ncbi:hypothetical protein HW132_33845 [Brasilonema sp. CT11]|nr:hypothetical protein [Brasilonema sp. CT11]